MATAGLQMAINANIPAGQMGLTPAVGTGQQQLQQSLSMSSVPAATLPPTPGAQPGAVGVAFQPAAPSGSLYVGDLHQEVTETMLYDKFKDCGQILSIRLCRDVVTRRSLGYAYVNFANGADAERALDTMNFDILRGRPIRIMWSQRDPSIRRSGLGNIFIKNLDKGIDNKALYDTFSAFGSILSCKISIDGEGNSRGFGFVHFETEEAARMAIDKVNGMLLNGKKVFVGEFKQRKDRPDEAAARFKNCFVKNFGESLNDQSLQDLFEVYGEILSAKVMTDDSGKSRGFGFVAFKDHDSAQMAVEELNGKVIGLDGKIGVSDVKTEQSEEGGAESKPPSFKLFVGRAMKKLERLQERERARNTKREERLRKYNGANIYVKNLVDDIDDEKLRSQFNTYGTITSARVMKDMHGRSRGFGFVCYSTPDEAQKAVTDMNGKMIAGKPIYVALAQLKSERQAQLQLKFVNRMMAEQQRQGFGGQQSLFFANQQGMQTMPFSPQGGPASARFPYAPRPRFPMQMGARPQLNAPGLVMNPLLAGMNGQMAAGLATGYPIGGLPTAANGQFGQPLNASFAGRQPNLYQAAMAQQRGAAGGPGGRPAQIAAMAQNQAQRAMTGGANPLAQKQAAEQQAAAAMLAKAQPAAAAANLMGINLPANNLTPALLQQLKQAQSSGMASQDVIRFLQAQNAALPPAPVAPPPQQVATDSAQELARQLASAAPSEQKQILGEKLYPLIHEMHAPLAGKITGMLLEMDNSELLHMLEAPDVLRAKVSEAFDVLQQHQMAGSQQATATAQPAGGLLTTAPKEGGPDV